MTPLHLRRRSALDEVLDDDGAARHLTGAVCNGAATLLREKVQLLLLPWR